jgi:hypothetical protein
MASEAYSRVYRLALWATLLLLVPSTFIGQESPNKTSGSIAAFMQELHNRGQFNGPSPVSDEKELAVRYKAVPGEILVIARPLSFFGRLLYPLMKG